jgi:hypothetical protein
MEVEWDRDTKSHGNTQTPLGMSLKFYFLFSSRIETDIKILKLFFGFHPLSSGIKWFHSPPKCSCGESNRGPPYQIQRQSPLNQLTFGEYLNFMNLSKTKSAHTPFPWWRLFLNLCLYLFINMISIELCLLHNS